MNWNGAKRRCRRCDPKHSKNPAEADDFHYTAAWPSLLSRSWWKKSWQSRARKGWGPQTVAPFRHSSCREVQRHRCRTPLETLYFPGCLRQVSIIGDLVSEVVQNGVVKVLSNGTKTSEDIRGIVITVATVVNVGWLWWMIVVNSHQ